MGNRPLHFWDGDSWSPETVPPIGLWWSTSTAGPGTATTTTITRTPSTCVEGAAITLTATVVSSAATGSVIFEKSATGSGSWVSVGSTALSAGKAIKTWNSTAGGVYFRARYTGSAIHASSTSANTPLTTVASAVKTVTETFYADWIQGYGGAGTQLSGTGHDSSVHQGYVGAGAGNRKSLIGFGALGLPGDAEVTKVELVCFNWEKWDNGKGTLVVGWHSQSSKPGSYAIGSGDTNLSRHGGTAEGGWTISLGAWAKDAVTKSGFRGIAIGPGVNNSGEYQGYSAAGTGPHRLKVTYETRT